MCGRRISQTNLRPFTKPHRCRKPDDTTVPVPLPAPVTTATRAEIYLYFRLAAKFDILESCRYRDTILISYGSARRNHAFVTEYISLRGEVSSKNIRTEVMYRTTPPLLGSQS